MGNVWYFDSNGITVDGCNATSLTYYSSGIMKCLVSGSGTEIFTNITIPLTVYIDGVATSSGWSLQSDGLHVTGATSQVQVNYTTTSHLGHYTFDSGISWLLPAYNTTVSFNQNYTLDTFYWSSDNTTIYFTNFALDGGSDLSLVGFSCQVGNMTVTNVYNGASAIDFSLLGSSSPMLGAIDYSGTPSSVTIGGVSTSSWTFDGTSLTTVAVLATSGDVEISYSTGAFVATVVNNFGPRLNYTFPSGTRIVAPAGLKVHFGTEWVLSTGTPMRMSCWMTSTNWVNYTVNAVGTQQVFYGYANPVLVIIDGVVTDSSGYSWSSSITGISSATSSAQIEYVPNGGLPNPISSYTLPLPIMFIFGIVGLFALFLGPIYAIHLGKQGEYRTAFIMGVIITAIGFALVVAWLWSV